MLLRDERMKIIFPLSPSWNDRGIEGGYELRFDLDLVNDAVVVIRQMSDRLVTS